MGLYERNLTNFKQRTIIENSSIDNSCVNCHHVSANDANNFNAIQIVIPIVIITLLVIVMQKKRIKIQTKKDNE